MPAAVKLLEVDPQSPRLVSAPLRLSEIDRLESRRIAIWREFRALEKELSNLKANGADEGDPRSLDMCLRLNTLADEDYDTVKRISHLQPTTKREINIMLGVLALYLDPLAKGAFDRDDAARRACGESCQRILASVRAALGAS
jgi:hypothetical protein